MDMREKILSALDKAVTLFGENAEQFAEHPEHPDPPCSAKCSAKTTIKNNDLGVGGTSGTYFDETRDMTEKPGCESVEQHTSGIFRYRNHEKHVPDVPDVPRVEKRERKQYVNDDLFAEHVAEHGTGMFRDGARCSGIALEGRQMAAGAGKAEAAPIHRLSLVGLPCEENAAKKSQRHPAPKHDDLRDWRLWMSQEYYRRLASGHFDTSEAAMFATWEAAQFAWRNLRRSNVISSQCGGCGESLFQGIKVVKMHDGSYCHQEETCLSSYGTRVRTEATREMVEFGLRKPEGYED